MIMLMNRKLKMIKFKFCNNKFKSKLGKMKFKYHQRIIKNRKLKEMLLNKILCKTLIN